VFPGGTGDDRIAGRCLHETFGGLHRALNGRKSHIDFTLQLAREDAARIGFDQA
jgi:hypothetical protein